MSEEIFARTYFDVLQDYSYLMTRNHNPKESHFANHIAISLRVLSILGSLGYANKFRYGTSMLRLIISRSSKYGLRANQPRIRFEITPSNAIIMKFSNPITKSIKTTECGLEYLYKEVDLFEELLNFEVD